MTTGSPMRHLREHHRRSVREAREHRHAASLQPRLHAVADLGEKGVRDDHQPQDLNQKVRSRSELEALASIRRGRTRVSRDRISRASDGGRARAS